MRHRKIETSSKEKEQEYLAAVPVTITTEGDKVIVRAITQHESLGQQLWRMMGHTTAPRGITPSACRLVSALDLDTAGGDVSANGLTGNIKVDTSGGDLSFRPNPRRHSRRHQRRRHQREGLRREDASRHQRRPD